MSGKRKKLNFNDFVYKDRKNRAREAIAMRQLQELRNRELMEQTGLTPEEYEARNQKLYVETTQARNQAVEEDLRRLEASGMNPREFAESEEDRKAREFRQSQGGGFNPLDLVDDTTMGGQIIKKLLGL